MAASKTLEEIENLPKEILLATDICDYLGINPGVIRWQAQHNPEQLGFPVIVAKSRVKIPKDGFVDYCRKGRRMEIDYDLMIDILSIKLLSKVKNMGVLVGGICLKCGNAECQL